MSSVSVEVVEEKSLSKVPNEPPRKLKEDSVFPSGYFHGLIIVLLEYHCFVFFLPAT